MRLLKYTAIGLAGLLAISVILVIALALFLDQDQDRIRDLLVEAVNNTPGYQLEIDGPLQIDYSRTPTISVADIRFRMPEKEFELSSAYIRVRIDFMELFSKHLLVQDFLARDTVISAAESADEEPFSWPFGDKQPTFEKVDIENLAITYRQQDEVAPLEVSIDSLRVEHLAGDESITLSSTGTIDATAFRLEGNAGVVTTLLSSDKPYPVKFLFEVMQTTIHADGMITHPHETADLDIELQVDMPDVQAVLELLHLQSPDFGKLVASGKLSGTLRTPRLADLDISVTNDKVMLQASGTVDNILTYGGIDLEYSLDVSDPEVIAWALPGELPRFNKIHSTGRLTGSDAAFSLQDTRLEASDPAGHKLEMAGSARIVNAPWSLTDLQATVSIAAPDTRFLEPFFGILTVIGPVKVTAQASMKDNVLALEKIRSSAGNKQAALLDIQGNIRHISFTPNFDVSGMDLQVDITGQSALAVGKLVRRPLPDYGPVRIKARYSGSLASSVFRNLSVQAGKKGKLLVDVSGEVGLADAGRTNALTGVELDIRVETPDSASLSAITDIKVPAMGKLDGKAHLSNKSGVPALTALDLSIRKGDEFQLGLKGTLANLKDISGINMRLEMQARDMNTVGQFFATPLPKEGQVRFQGLLGGSKEQAVFTGRSKLRNTTIDIDLTGAFSGDRPHVTGSFTTADLDVNDLGYYRERLLPDKKTKGSQQSEGFNDQFVGQYSGKKPVKTTPLFSKKPFDLSGLTVIDLDLELKIDKLSSASIQLGDITGQIRLNRGKLELKPLLLTVADNKISIRGTVDASKATPRMRLLLNGDDIDIGILSRDSARGEPRVRGIMSARANLSSHGRSPAELAASLDGRINMMAENAKVRSSDMNLLNVDVIGFVISNITSPKKDMNIDCAIFSMKFQKGRGQTDLFIIDTQDSLIRIDAEVNLADETMDIAILPRYKIGLFRKKKPMRIYGPMTDPEYKLTTLMDLTRETTRSALLAPLTISKGLLGSLVDLVGGSKEAKGSCDEYLQ